MADRIFEDLEVLITEIIDLKNEYTNMLQQNPVPWSNLLKVNFRARVEILQENMETWDIHIEKLESKVSHMRNDDPQKPQLIARIDTWKRDAGHRALKRETTMLIREGQGYLELNPPATINTVNIPSQTTVFSTPNVNIQKFDGDILKWKSFKQRFDHSIHLKPYPNIEKMIALLGLLEGDALAEVQGFEVSNENYNSVYKTLEERFGNDQYLIHQLQTKLRKIPTAKEEAKSIRDTVNIITNMIRQLQNLNVDTNNGATILDVIEKMPENERIELRYFSMSSKDATLDQILQKMKDMAFKAEIAADDKREHPSRKSNVSPSNPQIMRTFVSQKPEHIPQTTIASEIQNNYNTQTFLSSKQVQTSTKKYVCSFCEEDHLSSNCNNFPSVDEKINCLRLKDGCTNCARDNHSSTQCRSNVICSKCGGNHYAFLCPSKHHKTIHKPNYSNVSPGAQQGCLLSKRVTVMNPITSESVDATMLFDAGSQRSYVSDKIIRQLKLPRGAQEKLNIQGIRAKATKYTSSKIQIRIKTTENFEDIDAYSIEKIANSVTTINFHENDISKTSETETTPDILIGMDYFFHFITSFEKRNETVIVHSKVGQMLSKKVPTSQNNTISAMTIEPRKLCKSIAMGSRNKERKKPKSKTAKQKFQHKNDTVNLSSLSGRGECLSDSRLISLERKGSNQHRLNTSLNCGKSSVEHLKYQTAFKLHLYGSIMKRSVDHNSQSWRPGVSR